MICVADCLNTILAKSLQPSFPVAFIAAYEGSRRKSFSPDNVRVESFDPLAATKQYDAG